MKNIKEHHKQQQEQYEEQEQLKMFIQINGIDNSNNVHTTTVQNYKLRAASITRHLRQTSFM
jgi:hypothetical protein